MASKLEQKNNQIIQSQVEHDILDLLNIDIDALKHE